MEWVAEFFLITIPVELPCVSKLVCREITDTDDLRGNDRTIPYLVLDQGLVRHSFGRAVEHENVSQPRQISGSEEDRHDHEVKREQLDANVVPHVKHEDIRHRCCAEESPERHRS